MFLLPQVGVHEEHLSFVNSPTEREALLSCSILHQSNILTSDGDLVISRVKDLLEPAAGITAGAGHLPPRALLSKVK